MPVTSLCGRCHHTLSIEALLPRLLFCGDTDARLGGALCASHSSYRCQLITGAWSCVSVLPAPQRVNVFKVFLAIAAQKVGTGSLNPPGDLRSQRSMNISKQAVFYLCWMNGKFKFVARAKPTELWGVSTALQARPPPCHHWEVLAHGNTPKNISWSSSLRVSSTFCAE